MGQAITNLLTNAAKYTDVGGDIALTADIGADELTIAVKDNGIGISEAVLSRVFELFMQADNGTGRSQG